MKVSMKDYVMETIGDYKKLFGKDPRIFKTPGYPSHTILKAEEGMKPVHHKEYRSIIGKIMWLVKKVGVECSCVARELATHLDCPTEDCWRGVGRVIGYLKGKLDEGDDYSVKLRTPKSLKVEAWCDSDYAANKDHRRSVSGNIVTVGGCIVSWQSKTQKTTALSSTEAEYVALSVCAAECKFVSMLVDEMTTGQKLPFVVHEDNTGAIFMVNNTQVGARTKHIDVKYHFSKELVEDGVMKVVYINTKGNYADVMTKNVTEAIFSLLVPEIRNGRLELTGQEVDDEE